MILFTAPKIGCRFCICIKFGESILVYYVIAPVAEVGVI